MRRQPVAKHVFLTGADYLGPRLDSCVENYKRRRSVSPLSHWEEESKLFFERLLFRKKEKETVFVPSAKAKAR